MPSPFPGMNPYLENPDLWTEVHSRLIVGIADSIATVLPPQYRVAVEKRIYLSEESSETLVGIADVAVAGAKMPQSPSSSVAVLSPQNEVLEIEVPVLEEVREAYLEIQDWQMQQIVVVIELLSPTNKRSGFGREKYEAKRREILASTAHLIEIDLLRNGKEMPMLGEIPKSDYRILIARGNSRPRAQLHAFNLSQAIPDFSIPLKPGEEEPILNLQGLLHEVYDRARFDRAINYNREPIPPLTSHARTWADTLLRQGGLRTVGSDEAE